MSTWVALVVAGFVAGLLGTMTGVGSVFSYPVLLLLGLSPISANVTNTVSLAIGGATGAYRSHPEMNGRRGLVLGLCAAGTVGTLAGSALLLLAPPKVFELIVPFLVGAASISILLPRPARRHSAITSEFRTTPVAFAVMALVAIYNGYFAAGSSVLIIASLLMTTTLTLPIANGLKNVLVFVSDVVAAAAFAAVGPVAWGLVPPLVAGLLAGSWLGPAFARRLPVAKLRILIVAAGLGLAVSLGVEAYAP